MDRKYCYRHHGFDSDGDGECGKRATAQPEMVKIMGICAFDPADLHEDVGEATSG